MKSDVTILGGGLAGLSLAIQLRQKMPDTKITVLEKRMHPVPEAAHKVGESTVEVAAHYFGNVLGLKDHIKADQLPKLGLRFFFPAGDNTKIEERRELGGQRYAPCPSYQLDRGRFENYMGDVCLEQNIDFLDQANIKDVHVSKGGNHSVDFKVNGELHSLESKWLVDASGRRAFLKRKLGMGKESSHNGNAAWFRFDTRIKIDDWCDDPAWKAAHSGLTARWYSTNHFMGQGYWVWIIPLSSGSTSVGIVASEEYHSISDFNSIDKAIGWLEKHEPQMAAAVVDNREHLQDFRAIKRYAVECDQVFSRHRWGITGEAGFFHDPFYSPGSDFIAFSNTFLTDLISRDLSGKGFRVRAFSYDKIYKRFYDGTSTAFRDQYIMFGNPNVMPVKILWDYLIYWSITAFIFMQDRMCHQTMYMRNLGRLKRLGKVNHFMQEFYRQWHEATKDTPRGEGVIDISQMKLIREMNSRLIEPMDSKTFQRRFAANLAQLETLAHEIVAASEIDVEIPFARPSDSLVIPDAFEGVFKGHQRMKVAPEPVTAH